MEEPSLSVTQAGTEMRLAVHSVIAMAAFSGELSKCCVAIYPITGPG